VNFEAYLISKKIDSEAFRKAEAGVWQLWNVEFEQMHPNSFTSQKLYLINPVRRKYPLKEQVVAAAIPSETPSVSNPATAPKIAKPVMRPKPKIG
jgi:hypothetical protein